MASTQKYLAEIDRLKTAQKREKSKARQAGERVVNAIAVIAGAGAAGFLDKKYADKKLLGMSLPTVIGLVSAGIGITGLAGNYSDPIGFVGYSMLGIEAYKYAHKKTKGPGGVSGVGYREMGPGSPMSAADIRARMHAV